MSLYEVLGVSEEKFTEWFLKRYPNEPLFERSWFARRAGLDYSRICRQLSTHRPMMDVWVLLGHYTKARLVIHHGDTPIRVMSKNPEWKELHVSKELKKQKYWAKGGRNTESKEDKRRRLASDKSMETMPQTPRETSSQQTTVRITPQTPPRNTPRRPLTSQNSMQTSSENNLVRRFSKKNTNVFWGIGEVLYHLFMEMIHEDILREMKVTKELKSRKRARTYSGGNANADYSNELITYLDIYHDFRDILRNDIKNQLLRRLNITPPSGIDLTPGFEQRHTFTYIYQNIEALVHGEWKVIPELQGGEDTIDKIKEELKKMYRSGSYMLDGPPQSTNWSEWSTWTNERGQNGGQVMTFAKQWDSSPSGLLSNRHDYEPDFLGWMKKEKIFDPSKIEVSMKNNEFVLKPLLKGRRQTIDCKNTQEKTRKSAYNKTEIETLFRLRTDCINDIDLKVDLLLMKASGDYAQCMTCKEYNERNETVVPLITADRLLTLRCIKNGVPFIGKYTNIPSNLNEVLNNTDGLVLYRPNGNLRLGLANEIINYSASNFIKLEVYKNDEPVDPTLLSSECEQIEEIEFESVINSEGEIWIVRYKINTGRVNWNVIRKTRIKVNKRMFARRLELIYKKAEGEIEKLQNSLRFEQTTNESMTAIQNTIKYLTLKMNRINTSIEPRIISSGDDKTLSTIQTKFATERSKNSTIVVYSGDISKLASDIYDYYLDTTPEQRAQMNMENLYDDFLQKFEEDKFEDLIDYISDEVPSLYSLKYVNDEMKKILKEKWKNATMTDLAEELIVETHQEFMTDVIIQLIRTKLLYEYDLTPIYGVITNLFLLEVDDNGKLIVCDNINITTEEKCHTHKVLWMNNYKKIKDFLNAIFDFYKISDEELNKMPKISKHDVKRELQVMFPNMKTISRVNPEKVTFEYDGIVDPALYCQLILHKNDTKNVYNGVYLNNQPYNYMIHESSGEFLNPNIYVRNHTIDEEICNMQERKKYARVSSRDGNYYLRRWFIACVNSEYDFVDISQPGGFLTCGFLGDYDSFLDTYYIRMKKVGDDHFKYENNIRFEGNCSVLKIHIRPEMLQRYCQFEDGLDPPIAITDSFEKYELEEGGIHFKIINYHHHTHTFIIQNQNFQNDIRYVHLPSEKYRLVSPKFPKGSYYSIEKLRKGYEKLFVGLKRYTSDGNYQNYAPIVSSPYSPCALRIYKDKPLSDAKVVKREQRL